MILQKKVVVVMPAYNAGKTLESTVAEIDRNVVDEIVLVDDESRDNTIEVASRLNLKVITHEKNLGYGGNQKTCYRAALELGADIVIMVHPDYQYTPKLIPAMASVLACGELDISLGSRILGGGALKGGMPLYNTREPSADSCAESDDRDEAVGIPHGVPRLHQRRSQNAARFT